MNFAKAILSVWLPAAALLAAAPLYAAPTVSIAPAGNGTYQLIGSGFENAATVDLQISYDSSTLSRPRVSGGPLAANSLTAANVTAPGTISLSIFGNGTMTGRGALATVTFDSTGTAAGGVTSVTGKIIGVDGKSTPVELTVSPQSSQQTAQQTADTTSGGSSTTLQDGAGSSTTPKETQKPDAGSVTGPVVVGGSVTLPPDPLQKAEAPKEQPSHPEYREEAADRGEKTAETKEVAAPAEKVAEAVEAKSEIPAVKVTQSALERFRLFSGEATAQALLTLLKQPQDVDVVQEPAVAIADGKGIVKVTVRLHSEKAPNFAFRAARVVSVSATDAGWQMEIQPEAGALQASLMLLSGASVAELPLTVAPAVNADLDRSGEVTAADFALFLKERGKPGAPRFDLNGDGKRDYLDDYIFAANYAAATRGAVVAEAATVAGSTARPR